MISRRDYYFAFHSLCPSILARTRPYYSELPGAGRGSGGALGETPKQLGAAECCRYARTASIRIFYVFVAFSFAHARA